VQPGYIQPGYTQHGYTQHGHDETRPSLRRLVATSAAWLALCWLFAVVACSSASSSGTSAPPAPTPPSSPATEQLIWSDEFNGTTAQSAPNPANWTYDTGAGGWGNNELETYCAYGSSTAPCSAATPNVYVGSDGYLHILAIKNAQGQYTSARIKTQGLQSFQYGRIEARIQIPQGQGLWPAFWMLGENITTVNWPACGEMDIMENIGSQPTINSGSIHGTGFTGSLIGTQYVLPGGADYSSAFHTFGIIWSPKSVQYYVDSTTNVYARYTPSSLPAGAVWPFDSGKFFFILNLAVGGSNPGSPNASTAFPAQMLVDYVRVWQEPAPASAGTTKK
jgi:beta-glucanase (GH16 family)